MINLNNTSGCMTIFECEACLSVRVIRLILECYWYYHSFKQTLLVNKFSKVVAQSENNDIEIVRPNQA